MTISRFLAPCIILIGGCALSPQTVTLSPELKMNSADNNNRANSLSLIVRDTRENTLLGKRGGVYRDTAEIRTEGDITSTIKPVLAEALLGLGYTLQETNADAVLTVNIAHLGYSAEGETRISAVETSATVQTRCRNGTHSVDNEYTVKDKKDVLKAPSESGNKKLINDTLATAMQRMLEDRQLQDCLAR